MPLWCNRYLVEPKDYLAQSRPANISHWSSVCPAWIIRAHWFALFQALSSADAPWMLSVWLCGETLATSSASPENTKTSRTWWGSWAPLRIFPAIEMRSFNNFQYAWDLIHIMSHSILRPVSSSRSPRQECRWMECLKCWPGWGWPQTMPQSTAGTCWRSWKC